MRELNICYSRFDQIAARHSVEKLKTVGDCYLCVSGILGQTENAALSLLRAAFEIRDSVAVRQAQQLALGRKYWDVRIGLHTGPLVAGVVGLRKLAFDVWGDTVNVAGPFASLNVGNGCIRISCGNSSHELFAPIASQHNPVGPIAHKDVDEACQEYAQ